MGPPARAASGRRNGPLPWVQSGPPPECGVPMRASPGKGPWNGTLERVSGRCPSECASQRAPTCDCQGEVATTAQSGPPPDCEGQMRATPGTGPWNVSPVCARLRAPVRERQHVIAKARSPQAARLGPPARIARESPPVDKEVHLRRVQSGPPPECAPNAGPQSGQPPERVSGAYLRSVPA